jgi:hypothetical protein
VLRLRLKVAIGKQTLACGTHAGTHAQNKSYTDEGAFHEALQSYTLEFSQEAPELENQYIPSSVLIGPACT